jgi:hypothetical protein
MALQTRTDPPSVVSGETIPLKQASPLILALLGVAALALGGVCWAIHFALEDWLDRVLGRYETVFPLFGSVLAVASMLLFFLGYRALVRPTSKSLVIGTDRLQIVENDVRVLEQYHFRDVLGYRVVGKVVGIELAGELSADTIPPSDDVRRYTKESFGIEAMIGPSAVHSAEELLENLQTRLQSYVRTASTRE